MTIEKKDILQSGSRPTPIESEIELIFSERNINEDCDTIARLLGLYRKSIRESLSKGDTRQP